MQHCLVRALSAIAALDVASGVIFEAVILLLAHRIVPCRDLILVLIIFLLEVLSGKIVARRACRCNGFLVLISYITIL